MATHSTAARNVIADSAVDLLDVGTTNASARVVFRTSGSAEVATLIMSNPAFGSAASGVATAGAITADSNATGGTIDHAVLTDRDNNVVITGTVGLSGAEINLSSLSVSAGDTVTLTSLTYTGPN